MSNKGYNYEAATVDFWRNNFPDVDVKFIFRVEGGGRNKLASKTGTQTILEGDVSVELSKVGILPKDILIECKHYKTKREGQINHPIDKKWVDQARHEAEKNNRWSIVAIKFKNVHPNMKELREKFCWADGKEGNQEHYIIPAQHFMEIIKYLADIKNATNVDLGTVKTEDLLDELKRRTVK
jgi:hypothetical protein